MKAHALSIGTAVLMFLLIALTAHADRSGGQCTNAVIKAFKGQIIVSKGTLTGGDTDKATIAAYKAQRLNVLKGVENDDGVIEWSFHYTAFLKKKGNANLVLQFYTGENYVADSHLSGVDTSLPVMETNLSITEDDGPSKNKDYVLKLVVESTGAVVASTKLRLE